MRNLSSSSTSDDNTNGINGSTNGSSSEILKSAAATTQWKRKHYQTIEDKFQSNKDTTNTNTTNTPINSNESDTKQSKTDEPLSIESYEDVQPMWKEMESRVTKRRSLTLDERKGVSGRRNVRKSDEDVWLANGVYDDDSSSEDNDEEDDKKD